MEDRKEGAGEVGADETTEWRFDAWKEMRKRDQAELQKQASLKLLVIMLALAEVGHGIVAVIRYFSS